MGDRVPRLPVRYVEERIPVSCVLSGNEGASRQHRHVGADWELCYARSGVLRIRIGSRDCALPTGEILMIRPDDPHEYLASSGDRYVLIVRSDMLKRLPCRVQLSRSGGLRVEGAALPMRMATPAFRRHTLEYLLARLEEESLGDARRRGIMCKALLGQFFLELLRCAEDGRRGASVRVSPLALKTMETLTREVQADVAHPWPLSVLARRSGYSPTQLTVLFREVTGLTPCRWVLRARVMKACDLLRNPQRDLLRVAFDCGFRTRSQFHRAFQRCLRMTPGQYRRVILHELAP